MGLAAKALRETRRSVDEIARAIGYDTGAAFSKAFSRLYGQSPGRYRIRNAAGAATSSTVSQRNQ
jgi:AraC-like DNA-binding protein